MRDTIIIQGNNNNLSVWMSGEYIIVQGWRMSIYLYLPGAEVIGPITMNCCTTDDLYYEFQF